MGKLQLVILRYAFPSTCLALGTWQLYRLQWKRDLIKRREEGFQKQSIVLDKLSENVEQLQSRILRLNATRDLNQEAVLMGPRNARDLHLDWAFNLIAPIIFSDGVPVGKEHSVMAPNEGPLEAILEVEEKKPWGIPENNPANGTWNYKNISMLAEYFNVNPILFRRVARKCNLDSLPIISSPRVNLPNRHLEYVITWYSIAALTFVFSYLKR